MSEFAKIPKSVKMFKKLFSEPVTTPKIIVIMDGYMPLWPM